MDRKGPLPAHVEVYAVDLAMVHTASGLQLTVVERKMVKRAALGPQVRNSSLTNPDQREISKRVQMPL